MYEPAPKAQLIRIQGSLEEQRHCLFHFLHTSAYYTLFIDCEKRISRAFPPPISLPYVVYVEQPHVDFIISVIDILQREIPLRILIIDPIHALKDSERALLISSIRVRYPSLFVFFVIDTEQEVLVYVDRSITKRHIMEVFQP